jgi:hypothetical protein
MARYNPRVSSHMSRIEFSSQRVLKRERPFEIIRSTLKTKGIAGLYSGASALIIGNATKVRGRPSGGGVLLNASTGGRSVFDLRLVQTCASGQRGQRFGRGCGRY